VEMHSSRNGADVPIIVASNKTDLVDEHTMPLRVPRDAEDSLSNKLGVPFRPVSAKKGTGVHEAFNELIDLVVQRHCLSGGSFLQPKRVQTSALNRARNSLLQHLSRPLPTLLSSQCSSLPTKQAVPKQQPSRAWISNHTSLGMGHEHIPAPANNGIDLAPKVAPATTQSTARASMGEISTMKDNWVINIVPDERGCSSAPAQTFDLPPMQTPALTPGGDCFSTSRPSRDSSTEAAAPWSGRIGIPNLCLQEEVDVVEFEGDGGQSPMLLLTAVVLTPYWVTCMSPCCHNDGQPGRTPS